MERFGKLKCVIRKIVPRNVRCHKRRVFFESLFKPLKEVKDRYDNHACGYVAYDMSSFKYACHEMAAETSFYPFDEKYYINVGIFFVRQRIQPFYKELNVKIVRTSHLWKLFVGVGTYKVSVFGIDNNMEEIHYEYSKKMKIF